MAKAKAVDTKKVSTLTADFAKLYNLELVTPEAVDDKKAAEKKLISQIKQELDKYED